MRSSSEEDIRYLRKNTLQVVNYITFILIGIIFYVAIIAANFKNVVFEFPRVWLIANIILLLVTLASQQLHKRDRIEQAAVTLLGGYILAVDITLLHPGSLQSFPPYLFLLIVALCGLLISPAASFIVALTCILTSFALLLIAPTVEVGALLHLTAPYSLSVLMALITWGSAENLTTAFGWAVNSQLRAQMRRDQLFVSQQELKKANALLEATNIRLAEAQVAAEEANKTKTKFITNLSHELRTPLNAIITFSFILAQNRNGNSNASSLDDQQRNYLSRIQGAGEHLLHIVNDLLDLAKIEAGQMDLFSEEVEVEPTARRALQLIEGLIGDKSIELILDMPDSPLRVVVDPTRLQQILFNLLSNAAKYTHEGHIILKAEPADGEVIFSVTDTGIGIRQEEFESIFKEFHQTQEALHHKRLGTGLGLPISRQFIEMHGGKIWVESEVGVGSTFYFTMPLAVSQPIPT